MISFRNSNCAVVISSILFTLFVFSCSSSATSVNSDSDGIAIKGFDPVAYFTIGKPVQGLKQFSFNWDEATWQFSSKDHLDLFSSDPGKYAPQYGGY